MQNSGGVTPRDTNCSAVPETFTCDKCDHVLTSKEALSRHQQRHRSDTTEKRHRCALCSYATQYSSHLKQHMFTHSGERPFKCPACEAGFTQNWHLRKHMTTVHAELPATAAPSSHKCGKCSLVFQDSKKLQKHEKVHKKEEKPFRCGYCPKRFPRSNSLRRHEKRHLENKDPPAKRSKSREGDDSKKEKPESQKIRDKSPDMTLRESDARDEEPSEVASEKSLDKTSQNNPEKSPKRDNSTEKNVLGSSEDRSKSKSRGMEKKKSGNSTSRTDQPMDEGKDKSHKPKASSSKDSKSRVESSSSGQKVQKRPPSPKKDVPKESNSNSPNCVPDVSSSSQEKDTPLKSNNGNKSPSPSKEDLNLFTDDEEKFDYYDKLSSSSEKDFPEPPRSWKSDRPKSSKCDNIFLSRDKFNERRGDRHPTQKERELSMPIIWTDSPKSPSPFEKGYHFSMTEKGKSDTLACLTDKYSRKDSHRDRHRHVYRDEDFSDKSKIIKHSALDRHMDSSRSRKDRWKSTDSREKDSHQDKERTEGSKGKRRERSRSRRRDKLFRDRTLDRKSDLLRDISSDRDKRSGSHKERTSRNEKGHSRESQRRSSSHKERISRSDSKDGMSPSRSLKSPGQGEDSKGLKTRESSERPKSPSVDFKPN